MGGRRGAAGERFGRGARRGLVHAGGASGRDQRALVAPGRIAVARDFPAEASDVHGRRGDQEGERPAPRGSARRRCVDRACAQSLAQVGRTRPSARPGPRRSTTRCRHGRARPGRSSAGRRTARPPRSRTAACRRGARVRAPRRVRAGPRPFPGPSPNALPSARRTKPRPDGVHAPVPRAVGGREVRFRDDALRARKRGDDPRQQFAVDQSRERRATRVRGRRGADVQACRPGRRRGRRARRRRRRRASRRRAAAARARRSACPRRRARVRRDRRRASAPARRGRGRRRARRRRRSTSRRRTPGRSRRTGGREASSCRPRV